MLKSMAPCWRGQESGGISIALVAKHKRKDQLIDKILIRAFDSDDRSVKGSSCSLSEPTVKINPPATLRPLLLSFVSVSGFHWGFIDTFAKTIPQFG